jgi:anthranilate phosphoribosyltransferase
MEHELRGGDTPAAAAQLFRKIISGKGTWAQHAVVIANAAMALHSTGKFNNYESAYLAAVESFESGKALEKLNVLIDLQK